MMPPTPSSDCASLSPSLPRSSFHDPRPSPPPPPPPNRREFARGGSATLFPSTLPA
jgi:hypothetical protein